MRLLTLKRLETLALVGANRLALSFFDSVQILVRSELVFRVLLRCRLLSLFLDTLLFFDRSF